MPVLWIMYGSFEGQLAEDCFLSVCWPVAVPLANQVAESLVLVLERLLHLSGFG